MERMDVAVGIELHDRLKAPMQKAIAVGDQFQDTMAANQKLLKKIGQDRSAIRKYNQLTESMDKAAGEKSRLALKAKKLGTEMKALAKDNKRVPATLKRQYEAAVRGINKANNKHAQQKSHLRSLRNELRGNGLDTRKLTQEQERLGKAYAKVQGQMRKLAAESERKRQVDRRFNQSLQNAANVSLVADGMQRTGDAMLRMVDAPTREMRGVERAKGGLQSLGMIDTKTTIKRGQDLERDFAYMDTAAFVEAAYDIRSGIDGLSDVGVADVSEDAAITAKATKAMIGTMTELWGTGFGTFKNTEFVDKTNAEFSEIFGAMLAGTVEKFKTNGTKMQQAIESMGAGLAISGVEMSEQMAALGMLQASMTAGSAGTTLSALERSAAQANERFGKMGAGIEVLDENGNMKGLAELLDAMQAEFGKNFSTETGFQIQEAFGSEEAVKFFKQLWGQQDQLRKHSAALKDAGKAGETFTREMAARIDRNNGDARLQRSTQRLELAQQKLGKAMIPFIEFVTPAIDAVSSWVEDMVDNGGMLPNILIGTVAGVGMLAVGLAPVITGFASLAITAAWLKKSMMQLGIAQNRRAAADALGGGGGFMRRRGRSLGRLKSFAGKGGLIGAGLGALTIGSALMDDTLSGTEKAQAVARDGGAVAGGMGGAAIGAAIGTAILPGIGTAIGGVVGGWLGSDAGSSIGDAIGSWFTEEDEKPDSLTKKAKAAAAGVAMTTAVTGAAAADYKPVPAPNTSAPVITDQSQNTYTLNLKPDPGMDEAAFARKVREELDKRDRDRRRQLEDEKGSSFYDID